MPEKQKSTASKTASNKSKALSQKKKTSYNTKIKTTKQSEMAMKTQAPKVEKSLGKGFYLWFSILFYCISFVYINTTVYGGEDYLQTAIFAFASLFVAFVLMLFNVHKMVYMFFALPFKRLLKQAQAEAKQTIVYSVGKNKVQTTINKYRSILSLILYILFGVLIFVSSFINEFQTEEWVTATFYALQVVFVYLVIINSWQFLFHIIPNILDKSIDAKNGFVLMLSAAVIIIYVLLGIFDITYLSEVMIFILIIGFIALLGVNLNLIVGEINIFQNLRGRKSKAVTRAVFTIFFGFHIYIILYASVVAYSIYEWDNQSFVFNEVHYEITFDDNLYYNGVPLTQVYDATNNPIKVVYDMYGNQIEASVTENGQPIYPIFDENGNEIIQYYDEGGNQIFSLTDALGNPIFNYVFYNGTLAVVDSVTEVPATYGDFLYWTIISVSTIGYGDIAPSNQYPIAQAWGGFLGLYGLTFFALSISFVSNIAMEGINTIKEESKHDD